MKNVVIHPPQTNINYDARDLSQQLKNLKEKVQMINHQHEMYSQSKIQNTKVIRSRLKNAAKIQNNEINPQQ